MSKKVIIIMMVIITSEDLIEAKNMEQRLVLVLLENYKIN
jgi:hypothetical protein